MAHILVGTAYNQVLRVPFSQQEEVLSFGEKRKQKVICIQETDDNIYYSNSKQIYSFDKEQNQYKTIAYAAQNKKIIGCFGQSQSFLYYCLSSGEIVELVKENLEQEEQWKQLILYSAGSNNYKKAIYNSNKLMCLFGKGVLPFVYDFNACNCSWKGKNVPNDQLDLEVPIDDVDGVFFKNSTTLAFAHAFNKVRLYDIRGQRRKPTLDAHLNIEKVKLSCIQKSMCQNYLYVGSESGSIYELDSRKNLQITKKYKGITTSISDILITEKSIVSCSLDSYLRVFDRETRQMKLKKYLNIHPSVLHLQKDQTEAIESMFKVEEVDLSEDEEVKQKKVNKVKQIRKRNKVGLKYLEPRPLDVKLQEWQQKKEEENIDIQ